MKSLVTGAGGFIGSHLVEFLVQQGVKVRALVRYNSKNFAGWLDSSPIKDQVEIIYGDIRDMDSVSAAMQGCDSVFHLAALIGIPYSYVSPLAYIRTNVEGTYNVLESARQQGVSRVLVTSTSEVYGSAQYTPIDEKHPLVGQSPYSATKIAADQMAVSYYRSFNTPITIVRPFNTYGPRQSTRAVIPTIITQVLAGKQKIQLGNLTSIRDFNYVKDTVQGFWDIYQSENCMGEAVNIANNKGITMGDVVELVQDITGKKVEIEIDHQRIRPEKSEVDRLIGAKDLIEAKTKWKAAHTLRQGLEESIAWFDENLHLYDQDRYTV